MLENRETSYVQNLQYQLTKLMFYFQCFAGMLLFGFHLEHI